MREPADRVDVLVVDDKPENLLSLTAILGTLDENIVTADSGRGALRRLLGQSFAVILLDINMPLLSGFETAELIRQHPRSKHTPIIFLTAEGDAEHVEKSYALGAVDYISMPVVPEVLRGKVRSFAELYRKTEQVQRQAAALERHAAQLQRLTRASCAISSALSLDGILDAITVAARDLVDAHRAATTLDVQPGGARRAVSRSDEHAALGQAAGWTEDGPSPRPSLATPLSDTNGLLIGSIEVSEKREGASTQGDQAVLIQLAQLGSTAIQNCLHAEAREANRLKDEFLAMLSHELRTPLTALLGWTRLLRGQPFDAGRLARALEVIERNVNVQTTLIEELLDVSRIAAGKLRVEMGPIQLGSLVRPALDTLRPSAEAKGVLLQSQLDEGVGRVLGDAERLHQVVSNILGNAVKFTPKGGSVKVTLRRADGDAELVVTDTGEGISADYLPFVFERFRQADSSSTRAHDGLGLGLALVQKLVELHGGSVRAESGGPGLGATFVVRLREHAASLVGAAPVEVAVAAAAGEVEPPPVSGVHTLVGLRVLVVDDDDDARELLREVLTQHHAHVMTASSAREALETIGAQKPHVLVSDVAMSGGDGYELIRLVRTRAPQEGGQIPALALTAYAREEDRLRALEAGFQMHASKPIEPTELVAAVATLASGGGTAA